MVAAGFILRFLAQAETCDYLIWLSTIEFSIKS